MIGDTTLTTHRKRYSTAYPTDAPEKLCFGGKPHEVRPEGPQGAARERFKICCWDFAMGPSST